MKHDMSHEAAAWHADVGVLELRSADAVQAPRPPRVHSGGVHAPDGIGDWWWTCAMRAVTWLAEDGLPFSADDLARLGVPQPEHPSRWDGLLQAAAAASLVEPAPDHGRTSPARPEAGRRTWVGRRGSL